MKQVNAGEWMYGGEDAMLCTNMGKNPICRTFMRQAPIWGCMDASVVEMERNMA